MVPWFQGYNVSVAFTFPEDFFPGKQKVPSSVCSHLDKSTLPQKLLAPLPSLHPLYFSKLFAPCWIQKSKAGPTNCSAGSSRRSEKKRNREEISRSSARSSRSKMTSGATSSGSGPCQIGIFPVNHLYVSSIPEKIHCDWQVLSFLRFQPCGGSGPWGGGGGRRQPALRPARRLEILKT